MRCGDTVFFRKNPYGGVCDVGSVCVGFGDLDFFRKVPMGCVVWGPCVLGL